MPRPATVTEIQCLQGTVGYLSKFLPNLSSVMQPIRKLTEKDTYWQWGKEQEDAFTEVKRLVLTTPILAYYDPSKELVLQTDASQAGLGSGSASRWPTCCVCQSGDDTDRAEICTDRERGFVHCLWA